jgi:predicted O-methyltransferase YrrM
MYSSVCMNMLDTLLQADIGVHTDLRGGFQVTAGIGEDVLRWLEGELRPRMRTIEIGCGFTTVVFALSSASHTCISPFPDEHRRVAEWCATQDIDTSRIRFLAGRSDVLLPGLKATELDLALVDGSHAFPHAFIDYWYLALALRIGGVLVIDDTQLWTGAVLQAFLNEQPEWELLQEWDKTAAFRKTTQVDENGAWTRQPYVLSRSVGPDVNGPKGYIELLRHGKYRWALKRARAFVARRVSSRAHI